MNEYLGSFSGKILWTLSKLDKEEPWYNNINVASNYQ